MKSFVIPSSLALAVTWMSAAERPVRAAERETLSLFTRDLSRLYKYKVLQVIGGDALTIRCEGRAVLMGLLGVEAKRPEARAFLKELLEGQTVCLEYDPEVLRNERGWPIAYFYRLSDGALINQAVLAQGFGLLAEHLGPHAELLRAAAEVARFNAKGLWTGGLIARTTVEPSKEARAGWEATLERRKEKRAQLLRYQENQERKAMEWMRMNLEMQKWFLIQEVLRRGGRVQMQWTEPAPRGVVPKF
jgi:endonuclease YncB( thermonuclease family)